MHTKAAQNVATQETLPLLVTRLAEAIVPQVRLNAVYTQRTPFFADHSHGIVRGPSKLSL